MILKRREQHMGFRVIVRRMFGHDSTHDSIQFRAGRFRRNSLLQPSDQAQMLATSAGTRSVQFVAQRREHLTGVVGLRKRERLETLGQYADDGESGFVEAHLASDDPRIASKATQPETMA